MRERPKANGEVGISPKCDPKRTAYRRAEYGQGL